MTNRKPVKKNLSAIPIEHAHGGTGSRQLVFSREDDVVSAQFEALTKGYLRKGGVFDWHKHDGVDEFFVVLQGVGTIEYEDGTRFEYAAGDALYSPAGLSHRLENTGEDDNVFFFARLNE